MVLENTFYGVSVEAANTLGSYASSKDEEIKTKVFQSLITLFEKIIKEKESFQHYIRRLDRH